MGGWQESPWREFARVADLGGMTATEAEGLKAPSALIAGKGNDMDKRTEFLEIYTQRITRDYADALLDWLEQETDYFTAPASATHHGARTGGLLEHSLNVYHRLRQIVQEEADGTARATDLTPEEEETVAVLALLHDVCKVNCYTLEKKRRKNPATGVWEDYMGYTFRDHLPLGHGEKSLFLIERNMNLTDEEALAIRWHMGAYDDAVRGGSRAMNAAMEKCRWVWWLQEADMCATYNDEREAAE